MGKPTTKPKGATSYKETAFGIIPRSKLLQLEIEGTKRGLEYLYEVMQTQKNVAITPQFICALHGVAFGWIFPDWAGKYRKIQVTYSGKEAAPYYQLPELVTNLCRDLDERLRQLPNPTGEVFIVEVIRLLAWFQHGLVFIHPFQDYNGRIARMITILILLHLNLPPMELEAETTVDRKKYINAMQRADTGDYTELESLIHKALRETLERFYE
ncbi:Fic family protein [Candidatus Gottesmanbacteria bacterium]|nr:Fic family protein [Candidatus Gottesmanbacteria bacterium]